MSFALPYAAATRTTGRSGTSANFQENSLEWHRLRRKPEQPVCGKVSGYSSGYPSGYL